MGPGGSINISDPNDSTLRCLYRLDNVVCTAVFQVRLYFPEVNLPFTPGAPVMSCVIYWANCTNMAFTDDEFASENSMFAALNAFEITRLSGRGSPVDESRDFWRKNEYLCFFIHCARLIIAQDRLDSLPQFSQCFLITSVSKANYRFDLFEIQYQMKTK